MSPNSEEEERFVRENARRVPVQPERLLDLLRSHGFSLIFADRDAGMNEIHYLRGSPGLPGLFDILTVRSNLYGESAWVEISQSIIPSKRFPCVKSVEQKVPATRYGCSGEDVRLHRASDARTFERRLSAAAPELFATLCRQEGETLYRETAFSREAAERYLAVLKPDRDLSETLARLESQVAPEQLCRAREYVRNEMLCDFNLENFRVIWEIAGLCQVVYWEREGSPFPRLQR